MLLCIKFIKIIGLDYLNRIMYLLHIIIQYTKMIDAKVYF